MNRYYDANSRRLVYAGAAADESYWDSHWDTTELRSKIVNSRSRFVPNMTKRYLPVGSAVLEGGCGIGDKVWALQEGGYRAVGVDYASATVAAVLRAVPEIVIQQADVRDLPFPDEAFAGYWSLGVIEHFYAGYGEVLAEMRRVLEPGGYAFVTVPTMSLLRRIKARAGSYPAFHEEVLVKEPFFQFAIPREQVVSDFARHGFSIVHQSYRASVKGVKDEVPFVRGPLQRLFDSRNLAGRVTHQALGFFASPFAAHTAFFVFRRA